MQNTTIGFFGDSFCAIDVKQHYASGETYITKLKNHYNAEIVNLGKGGSSIWDLFLLQFEPLRKQNKVPDICVFVWTEPNRLFHRTCRDINFASTNRRRKQDELFQHAFNYYENFHDDELVELQYVSALQYFDLSVLPTIPKTTKIVHLWSFGKLKEWGVPVKLEDIEYFYTWKNGIEIRPSLIYTALENSSWTLVDADPNHLRGEDKNNRVFEMIKNAIDSQGAS
jgi:hypothetical protein